VSGFPNREGLQPERTALAWQRTSLTALVVLLPTIVVALRDGLPVLAAGGAAAALVSTGLVLSVRRRFVQLHDDDRAHSPHSPMVRVAAVTVLGAAGGAVVAVAHFVR